MTEVPNVSAINESQERVSVTYLSVGLQFKARVELASPTQRCQKMQWEELVIVD